MDVKRKTTAKCGSGKKYIKFDSVAPRTDVRVSRLCTAYAYAYSPDFVFSGETHKAWEIVYVAKGRTEIQSGVKKLSLNKDEIYIHEPYEFHKIKADGEVCNVAIIGFISDSADVRLAAGKILRASAYEKSLVSRIITNGARCLAGKNGIPLITDGKTADYASGQVAKNSVELLLIELIRDCGAKNEEYKNDGVKTDGFNRFANERTENYGEKGESMLVQAIKTFLLGNTDKKIVLRELAENFAYSVPHLCAVFKKATGYPIIDYFNKLKIEKAKTLILEGKLGVKEISDALGFDSLQYFSARFKRYVGYSPTQYANLVSTYKIDEKNDGMSLIISLNC